MELDECVKHLEHIASITTDSMLLTKAYHNIAVCKLNDGDDKQAEKLFVRALQFAPKRLHYKTLVQLSKLYKKNGRDNLSDSLYNQIKSIPDLSVKSIIYNAKYQECLERGEYQEAVHYANLYIAVADSFYNDKRHKEVLEIQKKYDYVELLYQNSQMKTRWLFTILLFIIILVVLIFIFQLYKKKNRQKYGDLQSEIAVLQNKFIDTTKENNQIHKAEMDILQEQIIQKQEELKKMHNRMKLMLGSNNHLLAPDDLKAMQTAFQIMGNRTCDLSKERKYLKHWLNVSKENFVERLETTYPILKSNYVDICCLTALGLSISEIAQIMDVNDRILCHRSISSLALEVYLQPN